MVTASPRALRPGPADSRAIRVAVCFEYELWNEALAAALAHEAAVRVVGAAPPEQITAARVESWHAEVGLTYLLPCARHWDWFSRLRAVLAPAAWIVLGGDDQSHAACLLRAGARGYLYADTNLKTLLKAIATVREGQLWADHRLAATALEWPAAEGGGPGGVALTGRERWVLEAVGQGKRNKEIASELGIAEATVKTHLNRVYKKLCVNDRLQAGLLAARYGWSALAPARGRG